MDHFKFWKPSSHSRMPIFRIVARIWFWLENVKGKEKVVVDVISRRPLTNVISYIRNFLIDEIKTHYATNDSVKLPSDNLFK